MSPIPFLALTSLVCLTPQSALPASQDADRGLVIIRGRAVCLDSSGREADAFLGCKQTNQRFGFESSAGRLYRFSLSDPMTPLFSDEGVRQRELQITARLQPGSQLEIIKVQSVREGKLFDIYYFCDVCNIRAYVPGLCPCCRNELQFKETPP